jgi:hypothetical protein
MAAGQGFKTFVTGEVLTAGDVNGYLMQGINVFATTTARDAAITAPAEGQFAFTKDTNSLWYYDGAAWVASGAAGDIEGVTAGVGISGGGTSGTVTVTNSMATAIDAKGDLVPGTGADTFARLAVGANDTVLTADSSTATGLKWASAGGSTPVFSLVTSGTITSGTELSITGLSSYDQLFITFTGANCGTSGSQLNVRFNSSSASTYIVMGGMFEIQNSGSTFTSARVAPTIGANNNAFRTPTGYLSPGTQNSMSLSLVGCKSATGFTLGSISGFYEAFVQTGENVYEYTFGQATAATLASVQFFWEDGYAFTGGNYRVYGA